MGVFDIPVGSAVRVYRERKICWEGPFKLLGYNGYKTAFVETENGTVPFSISAVRPFLNERSVKQNPTDPEQSVTQLKIDS